MRDNSANFFQSFLQEALVSSSCMGRDVHSLMLPVQHFLCQPQHRPPSQVPRRMVLERLSWCVTYLNHASCRQRFLWTHKEVDLVPYPFVGLALQVGDAEKFPQVFGFKSLDSFFWVSKQSPMFHRHRGEWRWQGTCRAWTCLWSWWCCSARSCLFWPLLPLLR